MVRTGVSAARELGQNELQRVVDGALDFPPAPAPRISTRRRRTRRCARSAARLVDACERGPRAAAPRRAGGRVRRARCSPASAAESATGGARAARRARRGAARRAGRALHRGARARARRDGHGLPRARPPARAGGRGQGAGAGARRTRRAPSASCARSAPPRGSRTRTSSRCTTPARRTGCSTTSCRTSRARRCARDSRARGAPARRRRAPAARARRRARLRARRRRRAPRPQAGERALSGGHAVVADFGIAKALAAAAHAGRREPGVATSASYVDRRGARHAGVHGAEQAAATGPRTTAPTSTRSASWPTRCSPAHTLSAPHRRGRSWRRTGAEPPAPLGGTAPPTAARGRRARDAVARQGPRRPPAQRRRGAAGQLDGVASGAHNRVTPIGSDGHTEGAPPRHCRHPAFIASVAALCSSWRACSSAAGDRLATSTSAGRPAGCRRAGEGGRRGGLLPRQRDRPSRCCRSTIRVATRPTRRSPTG